MFLVFSKEKIQTYIVSILAVAVLIGIASVDSEKVIQTSANQKLLPIYNVQTEEVKIAFTMNCTWRAKPLAINSESIESKLRT